MGEQYQATSGPYAADTLAPHDAGLVFAREFGTQTTIDVGDIFDCAPVPSLGIDLAIEARLGMLDVKAVLDVVPEPRGSTFALPPWLSLPESPAIGAGQRATIMFAHMKLGDNASAPGERAGLILAPAGFVGSQPAADFWTLSVHGQVGVPAPGPNGVAKEEWSVGVPGALSLVPNFGSDIYVRLFLVGDGIAPTTNGSAFISPTGVGDWLGLSGIGTPFEVGRVGFFVTGAVRGYLDWVRWYSYVIDSIGAWYPIPPPRLTGGRLFGGG